MKTHYVMDYETMKTCFVAVFEDYKTEDTRVFVVSKFRNDIVDLLEFLLHNMKQDQWHISYNGLNFDSQITQSILLNARMLVRMDAVSIAEFIYQKAQEAIEKKNLGEFLEFSPKDLFIKQIDVFRLNHWDNKAKLSSLKWIQYSMDWENIVDMPLHHTYELQTVEEQEMIIGYCINDVRSTKEIMKRSTEQIRLRKTLSQEYGIDLYSASETKISKELFMLFLSEKIGVKKYELRKMRTIRERIVVKDILLSYISFKRPEFQNLHKAFQHLTVDPENTKGAFKHTVSYRGVNTDYALGGLHGARKSGIYEAKDGMIIMTSDVTSFYPNLAIRNKWAPAHIPKEAFCEQYEWFFNERRKIPKKDPKNYVYKIILNATYGLSNEKDSFLYDPEFTMRITINGQLSLTMLYEMLAEGIPGAIPLMQNTDGLEMMIPEQYKDKYLEICAEWEQLTSLELEHDQYQKMIIGDVNNYIAVNLFKEVTEEVYTKLASNPHNLLKVGGGKYYHAPVKCKGRFEFENLPLHKNKSHLIERKAIYHYFLNGTEPEEYLKNNRDILDYCAGVKIKGNWEFVEQFIKKEIDPKYLEYTLEQKRDYLLANGWEQSWSDDNWVRSDSAYKEANNGSSTEAAFRHIVPKIGGEYNECPLQKTLRYYISNKGSKIIKTNQSDGREIQLETGRWMQTVFNKIEQKEWEEYDVNDQYYLENIRKELKNIVPHLFETQLKLF